MEACNTEIQIMYWAGYVTFWVFIVLGFVWFLGILIDRAWTAYCRARRSTKAVIFYWQMKNDLAYKEAYEKHLKSGRVSDAPEIQRKTRRSD